MGRGCTFVLFAVRETTQESLGFSPVELVCGHSLQGPLKVFPDQMLDLGNNVSPTGNVLGYATRFHDRMQRACRYMSSLEHSLA